MMEEQDLSHFTSIPWCSTLLSDNTYSITPTFSRQPKPSTEDSLIAVSLRSPSTITHCLSLYKRPEASPPSSSSDKPQPQPQPSFIEEVLTLVTLGSGMNGGANTLHGGIVATLMDDVMGTLLTVNKDHGGLPLTQSTVTASLAIRYLRGVRTPGSVAVWARCARREGRKFWLEAEVRNADGDVMARAEAVWVKVAREKGGNEKGML